MTVAKVLTQEFFFRFSIPEQLHSDQGRQFESQLIMEVCKLLKINKTLTTPYHPQGDGLVERFIRTLLNMLATTVKDHQGSWEDHIRAVCLAYNTSVQTTTGYSPFYLMYGRQARIPVIDIMFKSTNHEVQHLEYALQLRNTLQEAYDRTREHMGAKQEVQKQLYDRKVHSEPFKVGDIVWLHSPVIKRGQSKKLHHPWTGPYTVVKRLSDITYRIAHPTSKRQHQVVHFDRLKRCRERQLNTRQSSNRERSPSAKPEQPPPQRRQFGEQLTIVDPDDALTPDRTPVAPPVAARPLRRSTGPRAPVDRLDHGSH